MAFFETPRFPENIAYGSSGGPEFKTHVFEGQSGIEERHIAWANARQRFDVSYDIRDADDMDTVRALFYNAKGKAHGFRFKDWADYELTDELIATGDNTTTVFNITKTYTAGSETYVRRISKPVSGGIEVYVDGVLQTEGGANDYTLDYTTGVITFDTAPGAGLDITVTGSFDVPVRFDVDQMTPSHEGYLQESWGTIPLVELILDVA